MKQKLSIAKIIGLILAIVQLGISGVLSMQFFDMGFLPTKYWMLLTGILIIAFLVAFVLQFLDKAHWLGKIISILVIAVLGFGLYYVNETNQALNDISKKVTVEKDQILVVVKDDSSVESMNDLKDCSWGVQYADDVELMGKAVDSVKKELGGEVNLVAFDNYETLYPALMSGQVEAMILNSSYLDLIDDRTMEDDNYYFSGKIKIIKTLEFETEKSAEEPIAVKEEFDATTNPFILYISGIDTYGDISTRSRSDVNILMVVNPTNRQILLVTTPRDGYVVIPGISGEQKDKLTHAGIYGINKSVETINSIYDINIDYYARVNFNSVINIVDALGGVEVYSAYDFTAGNAHFEKGYNYMNGEQALSFSRERHALEDGDNQRGRDQLEVIKGIVNKCVSPAILTGFSNIMNEVSDQVQTSVPTDTIYAMVKMQLEDPRGWEMFSFDTKATGSREYCYSYTGKSLYVANLKENSIQQAKKLIEALMSGEKISNSDLAQ